MQSFQLGSLKGRSRTGIAPAVIVVILVVIIAIAGVGVYEFVLTGPSTGATTAPTITIGNTSSVTNGRKSTITIGSATSGTLGSESYQGTYTYVTPLGPFGINDSSGKPVEWNSTQTATGSFAFSVSPATYIGSGNGQGSMTVTTKGYCTGTVTVPYTFTIQAVHAPGENFIISFNTPSPSTAMVQLACKGSTNGFNTANNPVSFLSVYPNGLSVASLPTTASQPPTGGISYTVTITQSS